jgi:L-amino acid N-acyltransferase
MDVLIRDAEDCDLETINDIYNYYVLNSTCTFQTELNSIEERKKWFEEHIGIYPVVVAVAGNETVGWASLSKFHKRQAYKPTVENSVYIKNGYNGKGIGSILLERLTILAKENGFHSIVAIISADQTASINLHKKFNFKQAALLKEAGIKFGKRLDVVYYQLML